MSFNSNDIPMGGGGNFKREVLEVGTYPARLVGIATLGIQEQGEFEGKPKPPKLEIMTTYEFLDEFLKNEDGEDNPEKPRWYSELMPFSNLKVEKGKSTLRYKALDPEIKNGGDWSKLISTPCLVTLAHYKKKSDPTAVREKISNVSTMRDKEAKKAPELVNEPYLFDFYNPSQEGWERLPAWVQEKAKGALDFKGGALERFLNASPGISDKEEADLVIPDDDEERVDW